MLSDHVKGHWLHLQALVSGALVPLGLAPFELWWLALIGFTGFVASIDGASQRALLIRHYLFSLGMYGVGVSWIYVSIDVYGGASPLLAGVLVVAFIGLYSLTAIPGGALQAVVPSRYRLLALPFILVLLEWFRSWFLTGFPWLLAGYAHISTPLSGYAPLAGVFGVSLAVLVAATLLATVLRRPWFKLSCFLLVWVAGFLLNQVSWVTPGENLRISAVQGNVDQHVKWRQESVLPIIRNYLSLTEDEWGRDLVVWPEASITLFREQARKLLSDLDVRGKESGTALLLGIPDRDETGRFLNSAIAVGTGAGSYIKRRLVPFGEYVPMENLLRGTIAFFDLPMSRNRPGPWVQTPITLDSRRLSLSICYEVVYPDLVRTTVRDADLFVTISNDTWFGDSIGPKQHLQMAQMRALENGRWMVRATNNGLTALIDHRGQLAAEIPPFEAGVLRGEARLMQGATPFSRIGHWPLLIICLLVVVILLSINRTPRGS